MVKITNSAMLLGFASIFSAWSGAAAVNPVGPGERPGSSPIELIGLEGVGRVPATALDPRRTERGLPQDTLGGFGSAFAVDHKSLVRGADGTISGTMYVLPDRGAGDGAQDYRPRVVVCDFRFSPKPLGAATQDQFVLMPQRSIFFGDATGQAFTGADADDVASVDVPRSALFSPGRGRRSLDPEGLVLTRNAEGAVDGYYVSDEYGPFVYRFDARGNLKATLAPSPAAIPTIDGAAAFSSKATPTWGRRGNRGLEALTISPDGTRLIGAMQSPLMQDAGDENDARWSRIYVWDVTPAGNGVLVGEYVWPLARYAEGKKGKPRNAPQSEMLALDSQTLLVLERDNLGRGSDKPDAPLYKNVNIVSLAGATNILALPYSKAQADGGKALGNTELPSGIVAAGHTPWLSLLDSTELNKFGLNTKGAADADGNSLGEKWESLAIIPTMEPGKDREAFLITANDNDFKAPIVLHNGVVVGAVEPAVDSLFLVYRVRLSVPPAGAK